VTPCECSSDAAAINESDEEESPLPPRSDSSVGREGIARMLSTIRVDPELAAQGLVLLKNQQVLRSNHCQKQQRLV
jgi:hypothetical protein